jgi:gliding motility-associated-like protein
VSARGGTPPYSYALLPNGNPQADTVFTGLLAGDYQVAVIDALGCQATTNIRVTRRDSVLLAVPDSFEIDLGQTVPLYVQMPVNSPNNPIVTWTPSTGLSCTNCYQPTAQPSETTVYTVRIVGDDNCPVQASILVKVNKNYDVFIPNVFTPNGDGINDLFMVYSAGGVAVIEEMLIFDRWGELVFNRKDALPNLSGYGWDGSFKGKPMNAGVFVYYARIRFLDGTVREFKGDLTLAK